MVIKHHIYCKLLYMLIASPTQYDTCYYSLSICNSRRRGCDAAWVVAVRVFGAAGCASLHMWSVWRGCGEGEWACREHIVPQLYVTVRFLGRPCAPLGRRHVGFCIGAWLGAAGTSWWPLTGRHSIILVILFRKPWVSFSPRQSKGTIINRVTQPAIPRKSGAYKSRLSHKKNKNS